MVVYDGSGFANSLYNSMDLMEYDLTLLSIKTFIQIFEWDSLSSVDLHQYIPSGAFMDVFQLRDTIVGDYGQFIRSFHQIKDQRIRLKVESALEDGLLWPEVMVQLNPNFKPGRTTQELVDAGLFTPQTLPCFSRDDGTP